MCVGFVVGCVIVNVSPGRFQNMKQSSKYLFYVLVNSFMALPYFFLPIISYRFSSKKARVRVAYVGAILVPIAIPRVWI